MSEPEPVPMPNPPDTPPDERRIVRVERSVAADNAANRGLRKWRGVYECVGRTAGVREKR